MSLHYCAAMTGSRLIDTRINPIPYDQIKNESVFIDTPAYSMDSLAKVSDRLRKNGNKVYAVGAAASYHQDEIKPFVDDVLLGEPEAVILPKLGYEVTTKGGLVTDLDSLPVPLVTEGYYNLYPRKRFRKESFVLTGRGCAHQCSFCSPMCRVSFGDNYRYHSVNYIVDWISRLKKEGVDYITFMDDDFTFSRKRVMDLCEALPRVRWLAHARVDDLDFEMLKAMRNAGCEILKIGVESGSPSVLKNIKKTKYPEEWSEKAKALGQMARKIGIDVVAMFLVGVPGETQDDIKLSCKLMKEMDPYLVQVARYTDYTKGGYHYGHSVDSKKAEQYLYHSFYLRWRFLRDHVRFLPYHLTNISSVKHSLHYIFT